MYVNMPLYYLTLNGFLHLSYLSLNIKQLDISLDLCMNIMKMIMKYTTYL